MTGTPRELLVVAGEASGDLHGARLLTELRRRVPDLAAFGLGGDEMRGGRPGGGRPQLGDLPSSASPRCSRSCRAPGRSLPICCARWTARRPGARRAHRLPRFQPPAGQGAQAPGADGASTTSARRSGPGGGGGSRPSPASSTACWCSSPSRWTSTALAAWTSSTSAIRWSTRCRCCRRPGIGIRPRAAPSGWPCSRDRGSARSRPCSPRCWRRRTGCAARLPIEVRIIRAPTIAPELVDEAVELARAAGRDRRRGALRRHRRLPPGALRLGDGDAGGRAAGDADDHGLPPGGLDLRPGPV